MLQSVVLQTTVPKTLNVEGAEPNETLIIKSISGLSSTDVTLFTGDFARDGGYYQGRRAGKRNPVINFKINPNYQTNISASKIREMLYRWFHEPTADSDGLRIDLYDNELPPRYFVGYTEKIESDSWTKELGAQVSMLCTDPYLRSVTPVAFATAGTVSLDINYDGSADTGIELSLKVTTATTTVTVDLNGVLMVLVKPGGGTYAVNDVITINTNGGARSVKVNGVDSMAHLTAASKFVQLTKPVNAFKVYGTAVSDGKVTMTSYAYRSAWWGI